MFPLFFIVKEIGTIILTIIGYESVKYCIKEDNQKEIPKINESEKEHIENEMDYFNT